MYSPFFPNTLFGWLFCLALTALLVVAARTDFRRMVIPKPLTLSMLGVGIAASIVRGVWLAAENHKLWLFDTGNVWLGALDGLLFALAGAVAGFLTLLVMWMLGTCGGGDVKLMTALGAWVGPIYGLFVLILTLLILPVLMVGKVLIGGKLPSVFDKKKKLAPGQTKKPEKMRLTYSFPVAVATVLVLLWVFRVELQLADPRPPVAQQGNTPPTNSAN